jgi:hypothetical protein
MDDYDAAMEDQMQVDNESDGDSGDEETLVNGEGGGLRIDPLSHPMLRIPKADKISIKVSYESSTEWSRRSS